MRPTKADIPKENGSAVLIICNQMLLKVTTLNTLAGERKYGQNLVELWIVAYRFIRKTSTKSYRALYSIRTITACRKQNRHGASCKSRDNELQISHTRCRDLRKGGGVLAILQLASVSFPALHLRSFLHHEKQRLLPPTKTR